MQTDTSSRIIALMSWKKIRLPLLIFLLISLTTVLIFSLKNKIDPEFNSNKPLSTPESTFSTANTPISSVRPSSITTKNTATAKPNQTNTNSVSNSSTSSNNTSNSNSNSYITPATGTSLAPTSAPAVVHTPTPTVQPTTAPVEAVNIQIWVRGWQYVNNQQLTADGSVKIKKDGQEIASGSVNGDIIYKASNMPTNSNLEIYFYLPNGCGQKKQITTGSNSTLYQEDFSFSSSTTCL